MSDHAATELSTTLEDDRSPVARLRQAELRIAYLEGQVDTLREQVAALESADEHRRAELASAQAEAAEAQAAGREAQARAEERRHLVDELRVQLDEARAAAAEHDDEGGKGFGWRSRRREARKPSR
ncbi:hypothetical protein ABZS66_40230 [Dactylosporangium sp. NPDC005572]|uniref:hypothetical protein n=1 Tax=Dactylosporangium sp. NPDC005572 TaxID=3156889 RepID=UPI0033A6BC65